MMGLALMAQKLATQRTYNCTGWCGWTPRPREIAACNGMGASTEYYRIIDRIARGEKP